MKERKGKRQKEKTLMNMLAEREKGLESPEPQAIVMTPLVILTH